MLYPAGPPGHNAPAAGGYSHYYYYGQAGTVTVGSAPTAV
jgi:hypothetical protein